MEAFALSNRAIAELTARVEQSSCVGPTASLMESSGPLQTPTEIVEAIERSASEAEMLSLAKKHHGNGDEVPMHLDVGLYDQSDCPAGDLVRVGGIQFVLPPHMQALLESCHLDFVDGRFILVREGRTYHRLLHLAEERYGSV